jgi:hypothetical protein
MSTVILVTLPSSGIAFEQEVKEIADNVSVNSKMAQINLFFITVESFLHSDVVTAYGR